MELLKPGTSDNCACTPSVGVVQFECVHKAVALPARPAERACEVRLVVDVNASFIPLAGVIISASDVTIPVAGYHASSTAVMRFSTAHTI